MSVIHYFNKSYLIVGYGLQKELKMLSVREIQKNDVQLIVAYWMNANNDFLVNMGVDLNKMLSAEKFTEFLTKQLELPIEQKTSFCMIWLENDEPIGHSNTNPTYFGKDAFMHLHLWKPETRRRGAGAELLKLTIPHYFEKLKLEELFCQPYALNPAPHRVVEKAGFEFVKEYVTIPGMINYEQPVKLWRMTRERFYAPSKAF